MAKIKKPIRHTSSKQKKKLAIHATIREICLLRHPYCVICGRKDGVLQGGHLIPKKRSEAVRYDLMNVFTSCPTCNFNHNHNPHLMISWFLKNYGEEEYTSLVEKSRLVVHNNPNDLNEIHEDHKQTLYQVKKSKGLI